MTIPSAMEVHRHETATGMRLLIKNSTSGAEVFLDPMELEGLTRWHPEAVTSQSDTPQESSGNGTIYQNEFAMVEVQQFETSTGPRVVIKDLSLGAEVSLDSADLETLTQWNHRAYAPLVDPSAFVHNPEPDPDEV